jgi:hypothetical protein
VSVNPGVKGTFPMADTKFTVGAYAMETTNQVPGSWFEFLPGYASMHEGQRALALLKTGKTWIEFRRMFVEIFDDTFEKPSTRRFLKLIMMRNSGKHIPVRTGHLYDAIFRSMYFKNAHWGNARHIMMMFFRWPVSRPFPIPGVVNHVPPATGHGDPTGIIDMPIKYQAPNVNFIGVGPRGGLIYGLNDPLAQNDPTVSIIQDGIKQMQNMIRDVFQGCKVMMIHRTLTGTNAQVRVSGGGTFINIIDKP